VASINPNGIDINGLAKLQRKIKDDKVIGPPMKRAMMRSAFTVERNAKIEAPVDAGRLRSDIKSIFEMRKSFPRWARIGPSVFYAPFVEFGTGIYGPLHRRIVPTTKKALAFTWHGVRIVVRSVKGMRPRPFMAKGVKRSRGPIRVEFDRAMADIEKAWATRG